jgi:hypothetical protein
VTHAEALVYATAFTSYLRDGYTGQTAARYAWTTVRVLRECSVIAEDGGSLASLDMLAEFRAFGQDSKEGGG